MHLHRLLPSILLLIFCRAAADGLPAGAAAPQETTDTILARIKAPDFPKRDFNITAFGASVTGDCTEAIRRAIQACHDAGGGRVVIPPGIFHTGAVRLQSNVNLCLAEGATLKFDPDPAKYLPAVLTRFEGVECMNYSPLIYALGQQNIAITGKGMLDGSAAENTWWGWAKKAARAAPGQIPDRDSLNKMGEAGVPVGQRVFGQGHFLRPSFIEPYRCKNVLIEGVSISASPMWEIHPTLCTNVTVRDVNIKSLGPNNDGCDPESCRDVLIDGATFATGDDCIAIKSGRNNDGRRIGVPSENVVIRNCSMKDGHGGITIGSEISGGCRNVFVEDCKMDSPHLHQGFRFKSNAQRGGVIENVRIRNVDIVRVGISAISIELDYEEGANGPQKPVIRDVTMENVTTQSCGRVLYLVGFPGAVIENIRLINCAFRGVKSPDVIRGAAPPTMENVVVEMKKQ